MSSGREDDDALSWGGDDDPTLTTGREKAADPTPQHPPITKPPAPPAPPRAERAVEPEGATATDDDGDEPVGLGNTGLVGIGMIAAAFLLFAVGWLIAGLRLQSAALPVPTATLAVLTIAAALAPVVWFVTVVALTRRARTWVRFVWLFAGLVLLVPWPFLIVGGAA